VEVKILAGNASLGWNCIREQRVEGLSKEILPSGIGNHHIDR